MQIKAQSQEFDKVDLYQMTRGVTNSIKDCVGKIFQPTAWLIYRPEDDEPMEILSIRDQDGEFYTTNSDTFKAEFQYIVQLMAGDPFKIQVISGTSKNGRTYVSCTLVK